MIEVLLMHYSTLSSALDINSDRPIGTATRLTTASNQRPSSRDGSLGSNMRIKVEDVPTTRGGLGSIQSSSGSVGRQVQDRTYFVGVARSKISELESEIQRLQKETNSFTEDNKQYFALSKTAEDLSQQIENIRNELDDYNMARMNSFYIIDRLQTTGDVTELKKEIADLNAHNQQVESTIEESYLDKRRKEERIQRLEQELSDEKRKSEGLLENMNSELRQRYTKIKSISNQFQSQMDSMQNEVYTLENRMNKMREQMSGTVIKQEALSLIEQIYELELKHEQMSNESQNLQTPEHERQKLTEQVKEDNQELTAIEKQINELRERNENLKQSPESPIEQPFDQDTKQKYDELKNKEQNIDEFLSSYEQTREQYLYDIKNIQRTNLTLLALISRTLGKNDQLPTCDDYTQLKTNLDQHEVERRKSNDTLTILAEQHRKLKVDYTKLETLDQKLIDELEELKIKYNKMKEDLEKFNDLDGLKRKAERRKQQLAADKIHMTKQRQVTKTEIQNLQSQFEAIQTQLHDNETHQQLIGLEKRLQNISQTLFTLDETLASQNIQGHYEQVKRQALALVQAHNRWLIQRFQNSPIT